MAILRVALSQEALAMLLLKKNSETPITNIRKTDFTRIPLLYLDYSLDFRHIRDKLKVNFQSLLPTVNTGCP